MTAAWRQLARWAVVAHVAALLLVCSVESRGQGAAVKPSPEVQKRLRRGLLVRFTQSDPAGARRDARQDRLPALHVAEATPPTAMLQPGPFDASFEGYLQAELKGDYDFRFEGKGTVRLVVNGQLVFEGGPGDLALVEPSTVLLGKGHNQIMIEYRSPAEGDATFRTYWRAAGFDFEPVSPAVVFHDSGDPELVDASAVRGGRELFAVYSCFRCHAVGQGVSLGAKAMPEMADQAPSLADVGSRLSIDWMVEWILNPQAMRNDVTMPRVLTEQDGASAQEQAADIAAYLGSLGTKPEGGTFATDAEGIEIGEIVFEELGCISCHSTGSPAQDEFDRTTLEHVGAKFHAGALASFLVDPRRHYASSRMPNGRLDEEEVELLVAYLRAFSKGTVPEAPRGDPVRGKRLFESVGCANCHTVDGGQPAKAPSLATVLATGRGGGREAGCLAADVAARGAAPDFPFNAGDRQALVAFIQTDGRSLGRHVPAEISRRYVRRLNCAACHRRDTVQSAWPGILAEESVEGLPPEIVPPLTWSGEKLKPDWTRRLIGGELSYEARPWMKARMPAFPTRAAHLASGLSAEHGFSTDQVEEPSHDADLAEVGRQIAMKNTGLDCHQCHGTGTKPAEAAYEMQGVNFAHVASRLRFKFYRRWAINPLRVDPATKMPVFAPDGKTTVVSQFYDGDARKQFDALWHYLGSLTVEEAGTQRE